MHDKIRYDRIGSVSEVERRHWKYRADLGSVEKTRCGKGMCGRGWMIVADTLVAL